MSSPQTVEFKGYAMTDPSAWSDLKVVSYQPKTFGPDDVEIAVSYCGLCGSDLAILRESWGKARNGPVIVGHEVVGRVVRVGEHVKGIRPGDRVGAGGGLTSCHECRACQVGYENYCPKLVIPLNDTHYDGVPTQGGFSTAIRAHHRFVFPIPDKVELRHAASMMCAGLTVFHPLRANGCAPGKKVAILGVGGLGHYAILFAKAMGAEVYAFTRGTAKAADAQALGADHVVDTSAEEFWKPYSLTFDLIISTIDHFGPGLSLPGILSMLFVHGKFINLGLPAIDDPLPAIHPLFMAKNAASIGATLLGTKEDAQAMLELAAEKNIVPWIEELPMSELKQALEGLKAGKARYRYVLKQDIDPIE
ncbi:GroES-like protein [Trametes elegans]|nr:GroES-like protein [Trametes elegans]